MSDDSALSTTPVRPDDPIPRRCERGDLELVRVLPVTRVDLPCMRATRRCVADIYGKWTMKDPREPGPAGADADGRVQVLDPQISDGAHARPS